MSKYRNLRTVVDGIRFDSKGEAARWLDLRLLEQAGMITDLQRQMPYPMTVNNVLICTYRADFTYREKGRFIVEDFKGVKTKDYIMKKKLLKALYDIDITETERK